MGRRPKNPILAAVLGLVFGWLGYFYISPGYALRILFFMLFAGFVTVPSLRAAGVSAAFAFPFLLALRILFASLAYRDVQAGRY